jgi:hypothetical protein
MEVILCAQEKKKLAEEGRRGWMFIELSGVHSKRLSHTY